MASGNTLCVFSVLNNEPPATTPAVFDVRNGHPVLNFDAAADWFAVFSGVMPRRGNPPELVQPPEPTPTEPAPEEPAP